MKIALIGATGFVGAALLPELLSRNHEVTAVARTPGKIAAQPGLRTVAADVYDVPALTAALRGHDAVVSAFNPGWNEPRLYELFMQGSAAVVKATEAAGVRRLLVVGGAGSLYVAEGVQLVDTSEFTNHVPANVVPGARAARDALGELRGNTRIDWTFVSPPAMLQPGARSGRYRVGGEFLLMDGDSPAGISVADLAVAIADELETPRHVRARFTVASEHAAG